MTREEIESLQIGDIVYECHKVTGAWIGFRVDTLPKRTDDTNLYYRFSLTRVDDGDHFSCPVALKPGLGKHRIVRAKDNYEDHQSDALAYALGNKPNESDELMLNYAPPIPKELRQYASNHIFQLPKLSEELRKEIKESWTAQFSELQPTNSECRCDIKTLMSTGHEPDCKH